MLLSESYIFMRKIACNWQSCKVAAFCWETTSLFTRAGQRRRRLYPHEPDRGDDVSINTSRTQETMSLFTRAGQRRRCLYPHEPDTRDDVSIHTSRTEETISLSTRAGQRRRCLSKRAGQRGRCLYPHAPDRTKLSA